MRITHPFDKQYVADAHVTQQEVLHNLSQDVKYLELDMGTRSRHFERFYNTCMAMVHVILMKQMPMHIAEIVEQTMEIDIENALPTRSIINVVHIVGNNGSKAMNYRPVRI